MKNIGLQLALYSTPVNVTVKYGLENAMKYKKNRRLKMYVQSNRYDHQDVPTIVLKGNCLETVGFSIGDKMEVHIDENKIQILKSKKCTFANFCDIIFFIYRKSHGGVHHECNRYSCRVRCYHKRY